MSRATPARVSERFTVQGDTLLYAGIPRVPIDELHGLLSRGSGCVVRKGQRPKPWFQAQCAHYGLPADGTIAMLRLHLEKSLESFQERMREKAERVEKERLAMEKKSRPLAEAIRSPTIRRPHSGSVSLQKFTVPAAALQSRPEVPIPNVAKVPAPPRTSLPIMSSATKPARRNSELKAFERVKLSMKFSEPNSSGTDTESEGDNSFSASENGTTFPPPGLSSPLFSRDPSLPRRNRAQALQLEDDVVSGRWALHVTCNTMHPLPAPWRAASSKWLRGDMDVHLSDNRRALTADFSLFGMDGIIKSRKFERHGEAVCAWVKFVAQMPDTSIDTETSGDNIVLGPSEMQYGYLKFYNEGKIRGMLRCRRYGWLEFKGVRIGQPRPLVAKWSDFE
ncbi:hypothetical protein FRC12_008610 [Ceratobasidium sp. 428]|nr:hypothetical protein FRC12_008610 [Ceratobasidium sp. 428]